MKVLLVTGIFPPDYGGPASYVPTIASALCEAGHKVLGVVTLSDRTENDDSHYPFAVHRIQRRQSRWLRWLQTVSLVRRLAIGADVVYLNGLVLEGVLATKIFGSRPVVIKVVGDLIWERAQNQQAIQLDINEFQIAKLSLRWMLLRRLQGWYTARADRVIVPSQYLAEIVACWGVARDRLKVVYNAVPVPEVADAANVPVADIVTVARLVPWKGVAELITIAAHHDWSLRVVGDGPLRKELELFAQSSGANVSFIGHVEKSLVPAEIRRGRLFVLNSKYEGLPHIVLEAKACGVAVVATAAGGTTETIADGIDGWLVPIGDSDALAAVIGRVLLDESMRDASVRAAHKKLAEKFSFSSMVRNTEMVLMESCA
jgi:glycosyltransferase involved in cell wall biosynthesis